jgi:two-component system response regulator
MSPESQVTILVVEDNPSDAFLLRRALAKTNLPYQLRFVSDAQTALNYLEGSAPYTDRQTFPVPGLVLLDLRLPVLDGFDVLRKLVGNPRFGQVPVVVLSASSAEEDRAQATNLGAKAYYTKSEDSRVTANMFKEIGQQWLREMTSVTSGK